MNKGLFASRVYKESFTKELNKQNQNNTNTDFSPRGDMLVHIWQEMYFVYIDIKNF